MTSGGRAAGAIALIGAIIAIFVFVTGIANLPDLFQRAALSRPDEMLARSVPSTPPAERPPMQPPISSIWLAGAPRSCMELAVAKSFRLMCHGKAITAPLQYADREQPVRARISPMSPSGRYVFVALCDQDWCDDLRLVDLTRRRLSHIALGKYHSLEWVWWSSNEATGVLSQCHAGWCELSAIDLPTGSTRHLDRELGEGELHHVIRLSWSRSG
jgi:hypothetical protein